MVEGPTGDFRLTRRSAKALTSGSTSIGMPNAGRLRGPPARPGLSPLRQPARGRGGGHGRSRLSASAWHCCSAMSTPVCRPELAASCDGASEFRWLGLLRASTSRWRWRSRWRPPMRTRRRSLGLGGDLTAPRRRDAFVGTLLCAGSQALSGALEPGNERRLVFDGLDQRAPLGCPRAKDMTGFASSWPLPATVVAAEPAYRAGRDRGRPGRHQRATSRPR